MEGQKLMLAAIARQMPHERIKGTQDLAIDNKIHFKQMLG